jgi:hypothetical protein
MEAARGFYNLVIEIASDLLRKSGKRTDNIELIVNQGGLQNREIPREMKQEFKSMWATESTPPARLLPHRISCNFSNGEFKSLKRKYK